MKKQIFCLFLAVAVLFGLSIKTYATQDDISVLIDGTPVTFTADSGKPFVDGNGRTQVPLRAVMEQFGCKVEWDSTKNAAVITRGRTTVIVPIGINQIFVNNNTVPMDTAALIHDSRTYLPIRPVLEAFGAAVDWDNGTVFVASPARGSFNDLFVNEEEQLVIDFSDGSQLLAGNVFGNGVSGLTFADYPVGSKFPLVYPEGSFDVNMPDGTIISFHHIYYELTAKNDIRDADAWHYHDMQGQIFSPFEATVYMEGHTDPGMAGKTVSIYLSAAGQTSTLHWSSEVQSDGSFSISYVQDNWVEPMQLFFYSVNCY